jgi:aspartate carbamoyltransferase regulatory subunit
MINQEVAHPSNTLIVSKIKKGTVIDHIPCGQAIKIFSLLKLSTMDYRVMICLRLDSSLLKLKDLIKIENHILTEKEAGEVAIFAPFATINFISDFQVENKVKAQLPNIVEGVLLCPNLCCISRKERIDSLFFVEELKQKIHLRCHYCERLFARDDMRESSI